MKETLRAHLSAYDLPQIAAMAAHSRRVLSYLVALTYDPDPLIAWRSIEAFGISADAMADRDAEFVRGHLRRLLWLLSDESGGIGWRAPELIGELLHHRPEQFAEFLPLLIALLDLEPEDAPRFRAGALWAIARVASVETLHATSLRHTMSLLLDAAAEIESYLADDDPQVRGLAALCLARLNRAPALAVRPALAEDPGAVTLYCEGQIITVTVGQIVRAASRDVASCRDVACNVSTSRSGEPRGSAR